MSSDLSSHVKDPARLAALHAVALLDTPTEEAFDRFSRLAVTFVDAPVALVTLVNADRQFFKSCIGLPEPWKTSRETPLSHSFCLHNRIPGQPLLLEDARTHSLFKDNPAIPELGVIAYLGIPLITSDGYVLGSFCVIDSKPRTWSQKEVTVVQDLAAAVMTEIELRTQLAARKQLEKQVEERSVELQEKQAQYLHLEKLTAIGPLSASIAHEFNNPLQSITTILKGFQKYGKYEEKDRVLLGLAIDECIRMRNLIHNLQEFNRPSSGTRTRLDLSNVIESLLLLCENELKKKRISTVLVFDEKLPKISAVPDQIKQVILNLLKNAIDACGPKGGVLECKPGVKIGTSLFRSKITGKEWMNTRYPIYFNRFTPRNPARRELVWACLSAMASYETTGEISGLRAN